MGSKTKTITDLQRSLLITEESDKGTSWKNLFLGAGTKLRDGGVTGVGEELSKQNRELKGLYNKGLVANLGFAPEASNIKGKSVDKPMVLNYIQTNIDSSATSIVTAKEGLPTASQVILQYMRDNEPNFNEFNNTIVVGTDIYVYDYYVESGTALYEVYYYLDNADIIVPQTAADLYGDYYSYTLNSYTTVPLNGVFTGNVTYTYEEPIMEEQCTDITDENGNVVGQDCQQVQVGVEYIDVTEDFTVNVTYDTRNVLDTPKQALMAFIDTFNNTTFSFDIYIDNDDIGYHVYPDSVYTNVTITYNGILEYDYTSSQFYVTLGTTSIPFYYPLEIRTILEGLAQEKLYKEYLTVIPPYQYATVEYIANTNQLTYFPISSLPSELYTIEELDIVPHLPVKENGVMLDGNKLNLLLNKVGLDSTDLAESLDVSEINSAYVDFTASFASEDQASMSYLTEALYYLAGTGSVEFDGSYLNYVFDITYDTMKYSGDIKFTANKYVGSIGEVREVVKTEFTEYEVVSGSTFSPENEETILYKCHKYQKQINNSEYIEVTVYRISTTYILDGMTFPKSSLLSNEIVDFTNQDNTMGEFCVFPLLRPVIQKLPLKELTYLYEQTMNILVYVKYTIKIAWYNTGFFRFVIIAIAMYIAPYYAVAMIVSQIAVEVLTAMGVSSEIIQVLQIAVAIATMDPGKIAESAMLMAGTLLMAVSFAINIYSGIELKKLQSDLDESTEELEKAVEAYEETQDTLGIPLYNYDSKNPEMFYYMANGEIQYEYDLLYNYDRIFENDMPK